MIKTNYHTHTFRCGHANGDEEAMIKSAIDNKIEILGFSEHIPLPNYRYHILKGLPHTLKDINAFSVAIKTIITNGPSMRMPYSNKKFHLEEIKRLKRKYKDQITIYQGFEAEYFEEYLENVKCEILKPGFIRISPEINIKDYVEVNSAISLAISGLGEGITGINFKKASFLDRLPDFLKIEIGPSKKDKTKSSKPNPLEKLLKSSAFTMDFNVPLDKVEKGMLRTATGLLILFFVYSGFSIMIKNQIDNKMDEANKSIANTNSQMQLIDNDKSKLQTKTTEYTTKISNLQKVNDKINDINKTKKTIPNLLNKLMYIMPTGVQITSIQNTSATHIEIQAQSNKYEQLGFLVTNMQLEPVLTNVISTAGQKANGIITIKIEGDLP